MLLPAPAHTQQHMSHERSVSEDSMDGYSSVREDEEGDDGDSMDGYSSMSEDEEGDELSDGFIVDDEDDDDASFDDVLRETASDFHVSAEKAVAALKRRRAGRRAAKIAAAAAEEAERAAAAAALSSRLKYRPVVRRSFCRRAWWKPPAKRKASSGAAAGPSNKKKKRVADYVQCAHGGCVGRVHAGSLFCRIHSGRKKKKKGGSKRREIFKKELDALKRRLAEWGRLETMRHEKRSSPKSGSCSRCGDRRTNLFFCAFHTEMSRLEKHLRGDTRESLEGRISELRRKAGAEVARAAEKKKKRSSSLPSRFVTCPLCMTTMSVTRRERTHCCCDCGEKFSESNDDDEKGGV